MDIDTNTLGQRFTVITPLKSVSNATQNTAVQSAFSGVAIVDGTNAAANPGDVTQAVVKLNDFVQNTQRNLQFSIDIESGAIVVKVIDPINDKVIRQMPTEDALRLAHSLEEQSDHSAFNIFRSKA